MADCPLCHQQIEIKPEHHGSLYTCGHCGGVFFVGWDGQPEVPQDPSNFSSGESSSPSAQNPVVEFSEANPGLEIAPADFSGASATEGFQLFPQDLTPSQSGEPSSTQSLEPTPETQQGSSNSDSLGLDSVVEYANSLENQSPVTYSITIRGLDLAEHLQSVRDALTDSKFGWDTGELMSKVNNGELILSNLSPLVTVVLVNRMKYLPVELSWSQEVFANEK